MQFLISCKVYNCNVLHQQIGKYRSMFLIISMDNRVIDREEICGGKTVLRRKEKEVMCSKNIQYESYDHLCHNVRNTYVWEDVYVHVIFLQLLKISLAMCQQLYLKFKEMLGERGEKRKYFYLEERAITNVIFEQNMEFPKISVLNYLHMCINNF